MSGGFWAGAVPPWAYAVGACLFILAVLLGAWYGYGRGFKHAEEEARWAREQAKARRVHPVYRPGQELRVPPEIAHQAWSAHSEQALVLANAPAITTGEIQAITDETDIMVARWKADNDRWLADRGLSDR